MPPFAVFQSAQDFAMAIGASLAFGLIGIAMLCLGFKAFEKITPKLDIETELAKGNIAVGIVVGSLLFAIGYIVMHAIG